MVESYGVTITELAGGNLLAGSHPVVLYPIVVGLNAANDLLAGQVLGRKTSDNKYYKWLPAGTDYSNEEIGTGDGSKKTFFATLVNPVVSPGSVVVDAVLLDDSTETFSDNGKGGLIGSAGGDGIADYATGKIVVTFSQAVKNLELVNADYTGDLDGTEVPRAILARDTDASEEDVNTVAYFHGEFNEDKLDWNDASDPQIADAKHRLAEHGIYVKKIG
ncbi:head decoration protein, partial [candidate division WOR-3 bacterium]|nr:head decoration protein [candidate division WOR-3 bacterium]